MKFAYIHYEKFDKIICERTYKMTHIKKMKKRLGDRVFILND